MKECDTSTSLVCSTCFTLTRQNIVIYFKLREPTGTIRSTMSCNYVFNKLVFNLSVSDRKLRRKNINTCRNRFGEKNNVDRLFLWWFVVSIRVV